MLTKLSLFATWLIADPRRTFVVLFFILVALMIVSMVVPGAQVLAGDATSGS